MCTCGYVLCIESTHEEPDDSLSNQPRNHGNLGTEKICRGLDKLHRWQDKHTDYECTNNGTEKSSLVSLHVHLWINIPRPKKRQWKTLWWRANYSHIEQVDNYRPSEDHSKTVGITNNGIYNSRRVDSKGITVTIISIAIESKVEKGHWRDDVV